MIGRAITDVEKMHGSWTIVEIKGEAAILAGTAPVATMRNYQREVAITREVRDPSLVQRIQTMPQQ